MPNSLSRNRRGEKKLKYRDRSRCVMDGSLPHEIVFLILERAFTDIGYHSGGYRRLILLLNGANRYTRVSLKRFIVSQFQRSWTFRSNREALAPYPISVLFCFSVATLPMTPSIFLPLFENVYGHQQPSPFVAYPQETSCAQWFYIIHKKESCLCYHCTARSPCAAHIFEAWAAKPFGGSVNMPKHANVEIY